MITKIIRANAALVTNPSTNIKSQILYLHIQHEVEHVKKVENTNVVIKDRVISISFRQFLHQCVDFLPEQYHNASADDIAQLLEAAPVELTITNYKAGDKYVDENGVESSYTNAGSDIQIENLQLSELTRKKFDSKKSEFEEKLNKTKAVLQAFKEMNVDVEKITFSL